MCIVSLICSESDHRILENGVLDEVPLWFPGARLNYAENLLHRTDDATAITATGESGVITNYTFRELREMVRVMAHWQHYTFRILESAHDRKLEFETSF